MAKILLFLLCLAAIWLLRRQLSAPRQPPPQPPVAREPEVVRDCFFCGVHVPVSEGVSENGYFYCSPEHARRAQAERELL